MHYSIIQEFEGKRVEVITTKTNVTGILKYDIRKDVLVINPTAKYDQSRWVSTVINPDHVVAIRELKEVVPGDDDLDDSTESEG